MTTKNRREPAMHRRCHNGCTMCRPDAEGEAAVKLCGPDGERVTYDWSQTTCKACLKRRSASEF